MTESQEMGWWDSVKHYSWATAKTLALPFFPLAIPLVLLAIAVGGLIEIFIEEVMPLWRREPND